MYTFCWQTTEKALGQENCRVFLNVFTERIRQETAGRAEAVWGLAIVKKIIEDHKGKIWAESVEGEGTAMHINLLKYKDNSHYCIEDKSGKKSAKGLR